MVKKTDFDEPVEIPWGHTGQNGLESLEYLLEEEYPETWWNGRYEDADLRPTMPRRGNGDTLSGKPHGSRGPRKHRRGKKDRRSIRKDDLD